MRTSIAIYFDLENVDKKLNLKKLLEAVTLDIEDDSTPVFAIKLACGNTTSIANFREQLKNLNFDIREAPQVSEGNSKNRADLILTVEAFESLYQKSPDIDLYIFITSDTDFTVDEIESASDNYVIIKEALNSAIDTDYEIVKAFDEFISLVRSSPYLSIIYGKDLVYDCK